MTQVWMDDICPSLPTKSGTAFTIPMLATLTPQSSQTDICGPKKGTAGEDNTRRFKEAKTRNRFQMQLTSPCT